MPRLALALALALAVPACVGPSDDPGGTPSPHVSEPQVHLRVAPDYQTLAECEEARGELPFIRCNQRLELCPDGAFMMILDDSPVGATYEIAEGAVQVMFFGGDRMTLTIGAGWSLSTPSLGDRPFARERDAPLEFGCSGGGAPLDAPVPF